MRGPDVIDTFPLHRNAIAKPAWRLHVIETLGKGGQILYIRFIYPGDNPKLEGC